MNISIVIPTYRSSGFIRATLDSVHVAAGAYDYQIILIDDCSDDVEALERIVEASPQTRLIKKQSRSNAAVSRNMGIEAAEGDYIFLLDSDDRYRPTHIDKRLALMQKEQCDFCFGAYTNDVQGEQYDFIEPPEVYDPRHYLFIEEKDIRTSSISMLAAQKHRLRFNESLNKHQDWGFFIDSAEKSLRWCYDSHPGVVLHCDREGRMSGSMNVEASRFFQQRYLSDKRYISGFAKRHFVLAALQKDRAAYRYFSSRIDSSLLKPRFKTIKLVGDALDRVGLFSLLPTLLGTYKAVARFIKS